MSDLTRRERRIVRRNLKRARRELRRRVRIPYDQPPGMELRGLVVCMGIGLAAWALLALLLWLVFPSIAEAGLLVPKKPETLQSTNAFLVTEQRREIQECYGDPLQPWDVTRECLRRKGLLQPPKKWR